MDEAGFPQITHVDMDDPGYPWIVHGYPWMIPNPKGRVKRFSNLSNSSTSVGDRCQIPGKLGGAPGSIQGSF